MQAKLKKSKLRFGIAVIIGVGSTSTAFAIDIQPEDGIAPPTNIEFIQAGYISSQRNGFYVDGRKILDNPEFDLSQAYLRVAKSFEWSGRPSIAYLQIPYGSINTKNVGATDRPPHAGDLSLMAASWPYADRAAHKFFGVAGYLVLPTGDYDARYTANSVNTNLGENRYRVALQAGYHQRIAGNLGWQLAFDTTWYGDNDDFLEGPSTRVRLSRKPLYAAQTSLSYRIVQNIGVGASYFYTAGGETRRNGVERNDELEVQRYQLTGFYQLPTATRITLQYGADLKTRYGFKENRLVIVRLTQFF